MPSLRGFHAVQRNDDNSIRGNQSKLTVAPKWIRGRPAEFVRDGVTRLLPIEAQKIGNDFLDLVIRQVGVWHSLWIVEAPMCRLQEMCQ